MVSEVRGVDPVAQLTMAALSILQLVLPAGWPTSYHIKEGDSFDFVVVGAGSAGAVVATRLSEVLGWKVLLLEAGGDPPPASVIPSLFATLAHTEYDWDYHAHFDEGIGQAHPKGKLFLTRGKLLGGSSALNYEIYSRGVPQDYDHWNSIAPGWDWSTVLHYFNKLEGMTDPSVFHNPYNAAIHSTNGPVKISRPKSNGCFRRATRTYLNSLNEIGIKTILETNGPDSLGATRPHYTFANGRRSSTAEAYLLPGARRPNLHVAKFSRAVKVLIDPITKRAFGVSVLLPTGKLVTVHARKEVIVSAGSIDTPKLLMLSGIGPVEELHKHYIDIIADLPVGKNLHDHQVTPLIIAGKKGLESAIQNIASIDELDAYPVPIQSGLFNVNELILDDNDGTRDSELRPQFQIINAHIGAGTTALLVYGCRYIINFDKAFCESLGKANLYREIDMTLVVLLHPISRGQVTLKSTNPLEDPMIHLGFYRDPHDIQLMVEGVKYIKRLANTSYYRKVGGYLVRMNVTGCEDQLYDTDEYWECYVKNAVGFLLHPVGTCAMGPDGVVDERLRVHGISGLRVVDASIMPFITSGNTNTPTMMIGERASDLIKEEYLENEIVY